jgi:GntR family transcriptional regulator, transcriptional repressor for pyruvate dehydrogenase complex
MALEQIPGNSPTPFAPIERNIRLADRVAHALIDSIVSGRLAAGDKLPAERELCEQFGVSRPVVREAVRSLIAKGLLEDNPRRGHVVSALGQDTVTESLTLYLRGQRLDYGQLMEVRTVFEVENAGRAAQRATPERLDALRAAVVQLTPGLSADDAAVADVCFHRAIATATGNPFFEILHDSIREVLITVQLPTLADPKIVQGAIRHHLAILKQIEAGDEDGAREAMRAHLRDAERGMRRVIRAGGADGAGTSPAAG